MAETSEPAGRDRPVVQEAGYGWLDTAALRDTERGGVERGAWSERK